MAIIGPNGAGKTTLVKAVLGLVPYDGEINLQSRKISYVPQRLKFDRTTPVTVMELLGIYQKKANKEQAERALADVGAEHVANKQLGVLSGGEFQRVLVALALLNDPEVIFLDEPTAGVDVDGVSDLYELIQDLKKKRELTVFLVSHDVDVVYKHATSVICLNQKLVCMGAPSEALTPETMNALYSKDHASYHHHEK